jgi:hypothetical protein
MLADPASAGKFKTNNAEKQLQNWQSATSFFKALNDQRFSNW